MVLQNEDQNRIWENIVKHYEFIEGAQMSNSFILLMALNSSKEPLNTTQVSEIIANQSNLAAARQIGRQMSQTSNMCSKFHAAPGVYISPQIIR